MKRILIVLLVAFSIIGAFSLGFLINNKPINKEEEKEIQLELNTEDVKEEVKEEKKEEKVEIKQEIKVEKQYRCTECDKYVGENDFNKNTEICTDCEVKQKQEAQRIYESELRTCEFCNKQIHYTIYEQWYGCCSEWCAVSREGQEHEKAEMLECREHNHCHNCGECLYDDLYGDLCEPCYNQACINRTNAHENQ